MKGYSLFKKGKDKPLEITVFSDCEDCVEALVFVSKGDVEDSTLDVGDDEEIREVEVVEKGSCPNDPQC